MRGFRIKPNEKNIDLGKLDPKNILFICNMGLVNKIIAKIRGVEWNQNTQDEFDARIKVYFLIKTNLEYNVFFGKAIDDYIEEHSIVVEDVIKEKARKCIDHFIKNLK